jgi:hypothetical protein
MGTQPHLGRPVLRGAVDEHDVDSHGVREREVIIAPDISVNRLTMLPLQRRIAV